MCDITELIAPFSAISSWEGYEFQGHMALNFTFKRILDLIVDGGKIENFLLQLEGEEDFSIINDKKYESIHQVKSGSTTVTKRNKFTFISTLLGNPDSVGYFHRTPGSNLDDSFLKDTLIHTNSLLKEIDKIKEDVDKETFTSSDEKDDYIEKNIPNNNENGSLKKIFKYVQNNNPNLCYTYTLDKIQEQLIANSCLINEKLDFGFKKLSDDEVRINDYDDNLFINDCADYNNSTEIIKNSISLIKNILDIERPEYIFKDDKNYIVYVYYKLYYELHDRITKNRTAGANDYKCIIGFKEIYDVIVSDLHKDMESIGYYYYLVKKSIDNSISEYKRFESSKCENNFCKECSFSSQNCNLHNHLDILKSCDENSLKKLIQNLIVYTPKIGCVNNLPDDDIIIEFFIKFIHKINSMTLDDNNVFSCLKNDLSYRLTLINNFNIEKFLIDINEELGQTDNPSFIYEDDVIITNNLSADKVNYRSGKFTVVSKDELEETSKVLCKDLKDSSDSITNAKEIRLVKNEDAIKELG